MATLAYVVDVLVRNQRRLDDLATSAEAADAALKAVQDRAAQMDAALTSQTAAVRGAAAAYNDLRNAAASAAAAQKTVGAATEDSGRRARGAYSPWFNLFRLWGGRVALFGGLATIGTIHLLVSTTAEFLAVVIPATAALVAFGAAAIPTVTDLARKWQNMNLVAEATGKDFQGLTGTFDKVANAVRPQVYVLAGAALAIMNSHVGEFTKLATGAGVVIDRLAARIQLALAGGGATAFLAHAEADLATIGDLIGNLAGIIGNLLKAVPGVAEVVLSVLDGISHALEVITASPVVQGIAKVSLGFHGFGVYAGLAATAVLALASPLARVATWAVGIDKAGTATGQLAANAGRLTRVKSAFADIGHAVTGLPVTLGKVTSSGERAAGVMARLGIAGRLLTNPWTALGAVVVAGAVAFAVWMRSGTNAVRAATAWIASLQAGIDVQQTAAGSMAVTTANLTRLQGAYRGAQTTIRTLSSGNDTFGASQQAVSQAISTARANAVQYAGAIKATAAEHAVEISRADLLTAKFGSLARAQGLANQAGINLNLGAKTSSSLFHQNVIVLEDLQAALVAVARASGNFNNNLAVLDRQTSDQYTKIKQLNTAWDTFTSDMTGSQNAFDTMALGLKTLNSNATTASNTLGHAHLTIGPLGTALDGLSKSDLALNQAFEAQVSNVNVLIGTWRTAGVSSNLFNRGVKDSISTLVPFARGSHEATAQLVGLAQEAGFNGPASMKALVAWLGNTHGALRNVKDITNQATQQEALLTGAMQAQGQFIASKLIGDINQAILSYNGVEKAASAYGNAVARFGRQSDQARAARQRLISDLIASGKAAGDSTRQIAGMISKVLHIPLRRALQIVMRGDGSFSISQQMASHARGNAGLGPGQRPGGGLATGGPVRGPGTATSDSVPIWASHGEYVVKAAAVAKYGTHMMNLINAGKFASGGLVETGNTSVLSGQYAVDRYGAFQASMQRAMVAAMRAAIRTAMRQALAVGLPGPHGAIGGGVTRWAPLVLQVLAMLGQPAGDLGTVLSQMTTESGGNPFAINLTDINARMGDPSRGLMQTIMSTFLAYAGPFRGRGIYDPLANIYAGLNYAIHRYGAGWTSVLGHGHGYASGGVITEPILGMGASGKRYLFGEHGPETVTPGANPPLSTARLEALAAQLLAELRSTPAKTGLAVGDSLNGTARRALYGGRYGTR